jgi:hypothetical protein
MQILGGLLRSRLAIWKACEQPILLLLTNLGVGASSKPSKGNIFASPDKTIRGRISKKSKKGGMKQHDTVDDMDDEPREMSRESMASIVAITEAFASLGMDFLSDNGYENININTGAVSSDMPTTSTTGGSTPTNSSSSSSSSSSIPGGKKEDKSSRLLGCVRLISKHYFQGLHDKQIRDAKELLKDESWRRVSVDMPKIKSKHVACVCANNWSEEEEEEEEDRERSQKNSTKSTGFTTWDTGVPPTHLVSTVKIMNSTSNSNSSSKLKGGGNSGSSSGGGAFDGSGGNNNNHHQAGNNLLLVGSKSLNEKEHRKVKLLVMQQLNSDIRNWPVALLERPLLKKVIMKRMRQFNQLSRLHTGQPTTTTTSSLPSDQHAIMVGKLLASASLEQARCSTINSELLQKCLKLSRFEVSNKDREEALKNVNEEEAYGAGHVGSNTLSTNTTTATTATTTNALHPSSAHTSLFTYFHLHGNFFKVPGEDDDIYDEEDDNDEDLRGFSLELDEVNEEKLKREEEVSRYKSMLKMAAITEEIDEDDAMIHIGTGEEYEVRVLKT